VRNCHRERHRQLWCAAWRSKVPTAAGFGRYLESLRRDTRSDGIAVTDLAPGFIDSDMSRSVPNRFFVTDTSKAPGSWRT